MSEKEFYTKILCLECDMVLVSMHRHDFQMCGCENQAFADGGTDYSRIGAKDLNKILVWDYSKKAWRKCGYEE